LIQTHLTDVLFDMCDDTGGGAGGGALISTDEYSRLQLLSVDGEEEKEGEGDKHWRHLANPLSPAHYRDLVSPGFSLLPRLTTHSSVNSLHTVAGTQSIS